MTKRSQFDLRSGFKRLFMLAWAVYAVAVLFSIAHQAAIDTESAHRRDAERFVDCEQAGQWLPEAIAQCEAEYKAAWARSSERNRASVAYRDLAWRLPIILCLPPLVCYVLAVAVARTVAWVARGFFQAPNATK